MKIKSFLLMLFLIAVMRVSAQETFSYTPEKPAAGQTISVTYTPPEPLKKGETIELKYYLHGDGQKAFDGTFKQSGNQYTVQIPTDTSDQMVVLSIKNGGTIATNNGEGFVIPLYDDDQLKKGAAANMAIFYGLMGEDYGLKNDAEKGLEYMDEEFKLYPDDRNKNIITYLRLYKTAHPDDFAKEVQKQIEATIKNGLKTEDDYSTLQNLYRMDNLPQQSALISKLKEEKYPDGKWTVSRELQKFMGEQNFDKKLAMWKDISGKIDNDPDWKFAQQSKPFYKMSLLNGLMKSNNWDSVALMAKQLDIAGAPVASAYNSKAWQLQEKDTDLQLAERLAESATSWAKKQVANPDVPKPPYLTESEWKGSRERTYAMYADTYGMVEYKLGNYKKGLPYAEEAAIKISKGNSPDMNNTYALLASKALSAKKYVPILESMVKEGKATSSMKDILKEAYVKKHGEKGYENYMAGLEKEALRKMKAELKKTIMDEASPEWSLKDMDGNDVSLASLKGKVVVVDFWATWCGPCKASFPGMQKMVTKYKDDPNVKFVFVDTWETEDDKLKNAKDFITANKYDFHVLMDNDNAVVGKYGVSGIPTKFVIDPNGKIRFKSVGFNGSDDGLVQELSLMIDLAKES